MHKDKNQHLKNFFVIVPSLTLSFIDHMINSKDQGSKKSSKSSEFSFMDDGFALGVAFILKLLRQNGDFDGLHWFAGIEEYYRANLDDLNADIDEKRKVILGLGCRRGIFSRWHGSTTTRQAHVLCLMLTRCPPGLCEDTV